MKKVTIVVAALLSLSLAAVAFAAEEKPAAEAKKAAAEGKKPSVKKEKTTHVTATVEAVDLDNRIVTVKGPEGNLVDIKAGDQVKNLAQVKVGDSCGNQVLRIDRGESFQAGRNAARSRSDCRCRAACQTG